MAGEYAGFERLPPQPPTFGPGRENGLLRRLYLLSYRMGLVDVKGRVAAPAALAEWESIISELWPTTTQPAALLVSDWGYDDGRREAQRRTVQNN
jgi:hypothetical protein